MPFKLKEFLRAQLSAFAGGMCDLGIYVFCYKALELSAPFSNAIGGGLGAVANFSLNRYWTFATGRSSSVRGQLWKFVVVVMGSILLKSAGVHLLVDLWGGHFLLSKLLVEIVVSLGFNFTMQKFWVFGGKPPRIEH